MGLLKILLVVLVPVVAILFAVCFRPDDVTPQLPQTWWGKDSKPPAKEDETIRPFSINISDEVIADLKHRLSNARLPTSIKGRKFQNGFHSDHLKTVVEYWKTKYDWAEQQRQLNSFPQFKTNIDGIDVHFLRVVPSGKVGKKRPLMLIHGWPGSVWEFYKIIPLLTQLGSEGKSDDEAFALEIICPAIPGFGFSEAAHYPGFDGIAAAQTFYKLMRRLGHEKFYVQGGDWGSLIATLMGKVYPNNVIGVHVNIISLNLNSWSFWTKLVIGEFFPSLIYTTEEMERKLSLKEEVIETWREMGYLHLQSTKPDTVGVGLNDSPAGLAAYILEKFSTWSNPDNRNCSDGCITKHFTLDEVLTNVMIYWVSGSIGSSVRFYKEFFTSSVVQSWDKVPVTVPSGVAVFPHEILPFTQFRAAAELIYQDMVQYSYLPRGGHFAAFEEPQLMADDIKSFVKTVEKQNRPN